MEKLRPTIFEKVQRTAEALKPQRLVERWRALGFIDKLGTVAALTFGISAIGMFITGSDFFKAPGVVSGLFLAGYCLKQENHEINADYTLLRKLHEEQNKGRSNLVC
jgi:hypothetical protein